MGIPRRSIDRAKWAALSLASNYGVCYSRRDHVIYFSGCCSLRLLCKYLARASKKYRDWQIARRISYGPFSSHERLRGRDQI